MNCTTSLFILILCEKTLAKTKKQTATKEPSTRIKSTAVLPYIKGSKKTLRRWLQQQGVRAVFRSETTLRSYLVRFKDVVDPAKQDGVINKIPCKCGKVYWRNGENQRQEQIKERDTDIGLLEPNPPPFQDTAMRPGTIHFAMRLSLLTETHIVTPAVLKKLFV